MPESPLTSPAAGQPKPPPTFIERIIAASARNAFLIFILAILGSSIETRLVT